MTDLVLIEKTCRTCGDTKPLVEFYRKATTRDGYDSKCGDCAQRAVETRRAARRAEMGETAWLAHQRALQRKHRESTGDLRGKAYTAARTRAIAAHRREFDRLVQIELRTAEDATSPS